MILNLLIKEGDRERVQSFQGNVIRGSHITGKKVLPGKTFTVRRISSGVGVERTVPISSPSIESVKVIRKGKVTIENLPFQQDIANMSGTSRETVSRILRLFEDRNILNKHGHKLVIPDYNHFKRFFS